MRHAMKFTKMQAYCNDYVYVITFDQEVKNPAAAARFAVLDAS